MAIRPFGEPSRPRRRVRRIVRTFDLAGARARVPLARALMADVAERHAETLRLKRLLAARGSAKPLRF